MPELLPIFLNLTGRAVVLVGGGRVATAKLQQLLAAGARVTVVAPEISEDIRSVVARPYQGRVGEPETLALQTLERPFAPADLDGAWLVVAAATPAVNRAVAEASEDRHVFVNAVDDPANASAFLSGVVRRDGVTIAISTSGDAPALTALLREGLDALLPGDLASWVWRARAERVAWRRDGVPMEQRKPRLLRALNRIYGLAAEGAKGTDTEPEGLAFSAHAAVERGLRIPWLNAPEDSWL
jgi:uroporphyrin-III C-methyltransferase/precorrin-2 dehydrogenase/sirohydrochlorin ferrochelatase